MADNNYIHIGSNSGKGSSSGPSISSNVDQDALLPIANIGRIMKQVLPPSSKLSKEAKETMQECASEFISFITGEASHKCLREKRKTMNGDDVCWALASLGFDDYYAPLTRYLQRYRDAVDAERANQMCKAYVHHHHHQGQGKED